MSKNAWIILTSTAIVIISIAIVMLLILTPQVEVSTMTGEYEEVEKSKFAYESGNDDIDTKLIEEYTVTAGKIKEGIKENNYVPGNENPFTPQSDTERIEEEAKKDEAKVDPYKELTPADK